MAQGKITRERTYTEVCVEVDISDLADNGWHHEDDCPSAAAVAGAAVHAAEVITALHRQAHPGEHRDPWLCHREPCKSASSDLLLARLGKLSR